MQTWNIVGWIGLAGGLLVLAGATTGWGVGGRRGFYAMLGLCLTLIGLSEVGQWSDAVKATLSALSVLALVGVFYMKRARVQ